MPRRPIALRKPPLRRVGVEDEIRIAVEELAHESRAQFRIRADSTQQQPDQLARIGAGRSRAQELVELLLGRDAEIALISAGYARLFHLQHLRPSFALAGAARNGNVGRVDHVIECGTHRGFHTSLGRGDACTQY